jgi:mono/diheme cytochrome c family protein
MARAFHSKFQEIYMKYYYTAAAATLAITLIGSSHLMGEAARTLGSGSSESGTPAVQRGRYMVQIGGCNDCHTPGYGENAGRVEEKYWLTGNSLGWRGPWGTTYPSNLRLVAQAMDQAQWLVHARNQWRPPMPWFNLRQMSDADLGAIYQYLRHLGPAGERAPIYLAPGQVPTTPVVTFGPMPQ